MDCRCRSPPLSISLVTLGIAAVISAEAGARGGTRCTMARCITGKPRGPALPPLLHHCNSYHMLVGSLIILALLCCASYGNAFDPAKSYGHPTFSHLKRAAGESELPQNHRLAFLDKVLEGYDPRAWPTYGTSKPTHVTVNLYVNSIGPVSAANMDYGMDIYLRQSWIDERLQLGRFQINTTVTLNGHDLISRIWKPDLFFRNVKEANFHMVTVPNMLVKLSPDGRILYSMRLTLRLACHMSFRHYPLDTQKCHVVLGPYAQTTDQVVIRWQEEDPIVLESPIEVPEFDMEEHTYGNFTRAIDTGAFSFLNASFTMQRQNGYHLVQTYLPTFLIVMISWVSFWLNVDATPARVTLGVTTLLTLTTVASGVRTQLPPVSYVKAIDVWIGACSVMVFGALLEFTLVNYLSRSKLRPEQLRKSMNIFHRSKKTDEDGSKTPEDIALRGEAGGKEQARNLKRARLVDRTCRVMFPLFFLAFNIAYWLYYLCTSDVH